jgi:hypothetical protein
MAYGTSVKPDVALRQEEDNHTSMGRQFSSKSATGVKSVILLGFGALHIYLMVAALD